MNTRKFIIDEELLKHIFDCNICVDIDKGCTNCNTDKIIESIKNIFDTDLNEYEYEYKELKEPCPKEDLKELIPLQLLKIIICPKCEEIQPHWVKALPNGVCQKCFQKEG